MKLEITKKQLIEVCDRLIAAAQSRQRIIKAGEAAQRLSLSAQCFQTIKAKLIAAGLRPVQVTKGGRVGYLESSLDKLIVKAAQTEKPIVDEKIALVKIGPGGSFVKELSGEEPLL